MIQIEPIKAFNDNYIWAIINSANRTVWVVDPGDASPVLEFCYTNHLALSGILITHHHNDHCGGVKLLREKFNVPVYGPKHENILATHSVKDNEIIFLAECNLRLKVIHIPGHTLEHVAFFCIEENIVFCGDTLFSAGCGRIFEGTPEQMYASLAKLANLPDDTRIYCGHEYTLANLKFAKLIEPNNIEIDDYILYVTHHREKEKPSLPSTMGLEKKINPFLRVTETSIIRTIESQLGETTEDPIHTFSALREWKNNS